MNSILLNNEFHIWKAHLNLSDEEVNNLIPLLSEDEVERAEKYYFPLPRNHFVAVRGILRLILAQYLSITPNKIKFKYNEYGKPMLSDEKHGLNFNISHSGDKALFAFSLNRSIGIDLEKIRSDIEINNIMEKFFSPYENNKLLSLPADQQLKAFFKCWTRKEAFIKAVGKGLSIPLDSFEVSFLSNESPRILTVRNNPEEIFRWSLFDLSSDEQFCSAVAVEGQNLTPVLFDWNWLHMDSLLQQLYITDI